MTIEATNKDAGEEHHVVFFRIGEQAKGVSYKGNCYAEPSKQFKKLSQSQKIREDDVQKNIEFISEFRKAFFEPHYNELRDIDIYNSDILLMNYIQRCFESLKDKYQIKREPHNSFGLLGAVGSALLDPSRVVDDGLPGVKYSKLDTNDI